jgi:hypothetical protein
MSSRDRPRDVQCRCRRAPVPGAGRPAPPSRPAENRAFYGPLSSTQFPTEALRPDAKALSASRRQPCLETPTRFFHEGLPVDPFDPGPRPAPLRLVSRQFREYPYPVAVSHSRTVKFYKFRAGSQRPCHTAVMSEAVAPHRRGPRDTFAIITALSSTDLRMRTCA